MYEKLEQKSRYMSRSHETAVLSRIRPPFHKASMRFSSASILAMTLSRFPLILFLFSSRLLSAPLTASSMSWTLDLVSPEDASSAARSEAKSEAEACNVERDRSRVRSAGARGRSGCTREQSAKRSSSFDREIGSSGPAVVVDAFSSLPVVAAAAAAAVEPRADSVAGAVAANLRLAS